jgi:uncharacterized protein GlcG (DUF336 family)
MTRSAPRTSRATSITLAQAHQVVGAIGVSGGEVEQDQAVAEAGAAAYTGDDGS